MDTLLTVVPEFSSIMDLASALLIPFNLPVNINVWFFNNPIFLQKRDVTFLDEFNGARATGRPKYYAMKGGATGNTNTTSGAILLSPIPDTTYVYKIHYNAIPTKLEATDNETNFISLNFFLFIAAMNNKQWRQKKENVLRLKAYADSGHLDGTLNLFS